MTFSRLAFRNLLRQRTRTILTLTGIAASVAVLFSIMTFNRGFERGLSTELGKTGLHFMVVPSGCPHEVASLVLHGAVIPKFLDSDVIGKIREVEGISLVSPILVTQLPNPAKDRIDLVYGMDMTRILELKPAWSVQGRIPDYDREVLVGSEIASHNRIQIGDPLVYPSFDRTLTVSGILEKTGGQDDAYIYMPVQTVQEMLKRPKGVTAIGVKVSDPKSINRITEILSERIPGIQIVTMSQVMNSLANLAGSAKIMSLSIAAIAILISAVGVMNSILMAVFERTQEIGMMRAIGASRLDIFSIILQETACITTVAGIIGISVATFGAGAIEQIARTFVPYVPSRQMISFEAWLARLCVLFSLGIGLIAGLYPAWRASTINPIEAIKG
ncbi:MAG: ABC transporter permease [bacterium]